METEETALKPSINIYNESSLHNTLKLYYALNNNGKTEVRQDGHIYDILTDKNEVIEIQTKNLSKLKDKISDALEKGKKVRLVYPLVLTSRIILCDENGKQLSNRKSPKAGSIYDIFKEITGLCSILLNPEFTLEVVEVEMIEHRIQTAEPVQSNNKRRRFRKNWIKVNKRLQNILNTYTFSTKDDYLKLLPESLSEEFCAGDLKKELQLKKVPSRIYNNANLILWILVRLPVIEETCIKKRSHYYKIIK